MHQEGINHFFGFFERGLFFGFLERALRRKEKNDGPARGPSTQVPRCSRRQVRRPQDFAIPGCLPLHFHHYCHKAQGKRTAGQEEAPWGGACEGWPALGGRAGPQAEVPLRRPPQAGEGAELARRGSRGLPKPKPPAPLRAPAKKSKSKPQKEATEHIVENGSESRSTHPRASLSWRSQTAWPCRRLPRRHSRRSPRSRSRARHLVFTPRGAASWLRGRAKIRSPLGTGRRSHRKSRLSQLQTPQASLSVVCVRFAGEGC